MYLFTSRTAGDHMPEAERGERRGQQRDQPRACAVHGRPQSAHSEDGAAEEGAEPDGVAAHRRLDDERERGAEPVQDAPPSAAPLLARQEDQAGEREERDRQVGRRRERRPAALREGPGQEHRRDERGRRDGDALPALGAVARWPRARTATPGHRQEQPGDRAAERAEDAKTIASA